MILQRAKDLCAWQRIGGKALKEEDFFDFWRCPSKKEGKEGAWWR
jgi:hypothetical protein